MEENNNDIELFKETYNANYLQGFTQQEIQDVKHTVNPVLQRLIDNLYIPKTYNAVQYIEGPIEFYKLKLETGSKSFYIFGEQHIDPTGHCLPYDSIPFPEYIRRLAEETPSFFDLYIETPMVRYTKPEQRETKDEELKHYDIILGSPAETIQASIEGMLIDRLKPFEYFFNRYKKSYPVRKDKLVLKSMRMSENFLDCFQPSTRISNRLCHLMRIHNVDARFSWLSENITDDYYITVASIILINVWNYYRSNDIPLMIDLVKRLGSRAVEIISSIFDFRTNQIDVDKIIDIFLRNTYVNKELNKVEKNMKENIINFFKRKIRRESPPSVVSNLSEFILCLQNQRPIRLIDNYFKMTGLFLLDIGAYTMDIYCLARIFKKYNVESTFQPVESKNVIIYAGSKHSRIYREFLMEIGAKETFYYENPNNKNCVLVTNFTVAEQSQIKSIKDLVSILKIDSKNKLKTGEINQSTYDLLHNLLFNIVTEELKNALNNRLPTEEQLVEGLIQFREKINSVYSYILTHGVMPQLQQEQPQDYYDDYYNDYY